MSDMDDSSTERKHRSPAYPFVSLRKAVDRARELYRHERRHAAPVAAVAGHWGYGGKSSGALQTVSALKQFGLLAEEGGGAERKVKLTDRALKIILDEVSNSAERHEALKAAARSPKLYSEMLSRWGIDLPSDETIRTFLRLDKRYNDDVLNSVIRCFRDTLDFAKLSTSDTLEEPDGDDDSHGAPAVGDFVQWTSQGAWQFSSPKKLVGVSDGGEYGFLEGESTGVPMSELTKVEHQAGTDRLRVPPLSPFSAPTCEPKAYADDPNSALALNIPFAKGTINVVVRVSGGAIRPAHLARVRKYLELAESEWDVESDGDGDGDPHAGRN